MASTAPGLLRPLGVVGYDALEPALLAALATEEPLLLVSDHGAAKTLLLLRLAHALGLAHRHYNASLLQFDDLAGFPIPDERTGAIRYAAPPGAIWDAEAVFLDEIGRCRPEVANKLFPIVHERRIQGIALERLRYRWAATNPPPEAHEADPEDDAYEGVERLDPALADRFAYIVALPRFDQLADADRLAIVRGVGEAASPGAPAIVRALVEGTRDLITAASPALRECAAQYVLAVAPRLRDAKVTVGGRRAATLARNLVAVWAAHVMLGRPRDGDAFLLALQASIPEVVRRPVPRTKLLAAHRQAWEQVTVPEETPERQLLAVRDPVRRAALALTLHGVAAPARGEALCGALAQLSPTDAAIVAWQLLPRLQAADRAVPATAVETVATIVGPIAGGGAAVRGWGAAVHWVAAVRAAIARSSLLPEDAEYVCNAICTLTPIPPQHSSGIRPQAIEAELVGPALAAWLACAAALGTPAAAPPSAAPAPTIKAGTGRGRGRRGAAA
jgi:MoxR-like ATPase